MQCCELNHCDHKIFHTVLYDLDDIRRLRCTPNAVARNKNCLRWCMKMFHVRTNLFINERDNCIVWLKNSTFLSSLSSSEKKYLILWIINCIKLFSIFSFNYFEITFTNVWFNVSREMIQEKEQIVYRSRTFKTHWWLCGRRWV